MKAPEWILFPDNHEKPLPKLILQMHAKYGATSDRRCKSCVHLTHYDYTRRYYKCEIYGESNSAATDWRVNYPACGKWEAKIK
jgi:hypothetical protein